MIETLVNGNQAEPCRMTEKYSRPPDGVGLRKSGPRLKGLWLPEGPGLGWMM